MRPMRMAPPHAFAITVTPYLDVNGNGCWRAAWTDTAGKIHRQHRQKYRGGSPDDDRYAFVIEVANKRSHPQVYGGFVFIEAYATKGHVYTPVMFGDPHNGHRILIDHVRHNSLRRNDDTGACDWRTYPRSDE